MNLNLTYPDLMEGQEFLTETDPKALKNLIENDGSSNLNSDIKRITQLLHDLNRCPKSLAKSESIIKLFHSKYSSFSRALRDYSNESVRESSSSDELMHEFTREMAFACKAYLVLLNEQNKWVFGLPKKAAWGANYAMHYLSLLKAELYSFKRALPSYLWQELIGLYQFAETYKLINIKVKEATDNKISISSNIKSTFVRASLMASMEPYTLKRVELWNLFHKLNGYLSEVEISNDVEIIKESHCFAFNYQVFERPKLLKSEKKHNQNSRYINIDSFAQKVKGELKLYNSNELQKFPSLSSNDPTLQEKLLQTMYKYSVQYISRSSDRYPVNVETKVISGFQNILRLLKSGLDLSIFPAEQRYDELISHINGEQDILWQMINESQGGACIKHEQFSDFQIADSTPFLISKKLPNQEGAWKLSMSRWNKSSNNETKIGLKYIRGNLSLASNQKKSDEEFLFIGPDKKGNAFLLASKAALQGVKNFVISVNDEKLLVSKKALFPFSDSNLIKIEVIKKSS